MTDAVDEINRILKGADTDLARFWLENGGTDLVTPYADSEGFRKPINENSQGGELRGQLKRVGTTGGDWVTGRQRFLVFDVDHIDGHAGGYTTEEITAAFAALPPYVAGYTSKSGKGMECVIPIDAPATCRADTARLGRRLKAKLAADGFPVEMIDVIGQNAWVWSDSTAPDGHRLVRPATTTITVDDLPPLLEPPRVEYARGETPMTANHERDIEILMAKGQCKPVFDPATGTWLVHMCDLPLIDPRFESISPGRNPTQPHGTIKPYGDGAWLVKRFGNPKEHPSWTVTEDGRSYAILNKHLETDYSDFQNDWRPTVTTEPPDKYASIQPVPLSRLRKENPVKARPVIDGLLRIAEVMNIIASPKIGKSWLVYYILLCIVTGRPIFGFPTMEGLGLLIDNELKAATIWDRIDTVARAMGIAPEEYEGKIHVCALRGNIQNLNQIEEGIINRQEAGMYVIAVVDSLYRTNPGGAAGENDNGAMTMAYNQLDRMAERLQAGVILIHHASKGSQADKGVTDIGSGAGAQSRAADAHVVLRDHVDDNCVVMEARVRSFAPAEPRVIRWEYPLWTVVPDADPTQLRRPTKTDPRAKLIERETARAEAQRTRDEKAKEIILDRLKQGPLSLRKLTNSLTGTEVIKTHLPRLLEEMTDAELIEQRPAMVAGNKCLTFQTRA